jgi:hypothetical protein
MAPPFPLSLKHEQRLDSNPFENQPPRFLLRARPITGRKRDAPEARSGLPELDSYFCRAAWLPLNGYHPALLFFPTERVLQNELLIRRYPGCEADQCAMGANRQRVSPFKTVSAHL